MRKSIILAFGILTLICGHAMALTSEQAPVDSKGVALIDPDQKFDDIGNIAGKNSSASSLNFGDVTFSMTGNNGNGQAGDVLRPATVQTGSELFQSMTVPTQRWH